MTVLRTDGSWIKQAFLVQADKLDKEMNYRKVFSTTSLKFTDTTPGGNVCINPPPQFNKTTDIRAPGIFVPAKGIHQPVYAGAKGMGRFYGEAIDDNSQIIHMRFGVPKFSSLTGFFSSFYNSEMGYLARTGRSRTAFYSIGKVIGFVVPFLNVVTLSVWVMWRGSKMLFGSNNSKFYSLKPTMPLYWNAVQGMINKIAVNKKIIPSFSPGKDPDVDKKFFNDSGQAAMNAELGEIFRPDGGIDVYAVANRAQRLSHRRIQAMAKMLGNTDHLGVVDKLWHYLTTPGNAEDTTKRTFADYIKSWEETSGSQPTPGENNTVKDEKKVDVVNDKPNVTTESADDDAGADSWWTFLKAELEDGSAFASFRVNATGAVNESFSNSVGDSELANKINGMSSSSRSSNFSFAGGNLDDSVIGKTISGLMGAAADLAGGIADGLGVSGLALLGGGGFVDIPKYWQSSSANLPRATYTIRLASPYATPLSQLIHIYLPLSMLLAGALPLSTGKASYTSPFILEIFDKGRLQSRTAMIDSLSVTRGTSSLSFNQQGEPLAIDVSFSIVDLSSIMHMPISTSILSGDDLTSVFDDGSSYSNYIAVLSSMNLTDQIYFFPKLYNRITQNLAKWETATRGSYWASYLALGNPVGRMASALFRPITK